MIGFNGDDPLDPNAKKSLIDGLTGGPSASGIGGPNGKMLGAFMNSANKKIADVPGLSPSAPAPRNFDLAGGAKMTINDPTVGFNPDPGGQPTDAYGTAVGQKNPSAPSPVDDIYHRNYSSGSNINNSGKNKFGRFKAALGHDPSDDEIRQFVAANPNEWEDSTSPNGEYVFRQKQGFLNDPNNLDSKTGANTIWQNRNFVNAAGSGDGYAPPYEEHQAELPGQTGAGPFGYLDPMIAGNPMGNIQDALAAVQRPGTIQEIIARLQKGA